MKKRYETPTTHCVEIALQQMIALSAGGYTDQVINNLSRRVDYSDFDYSDWEDDEEEEFDDEEEF